MKLKKQSFFLFTITFLFIKCAPTLNYIGNNYTPTTNVSVYYDADQIVRKYKIMGLLTFNTEPIYDNHDNREVSDLIIN
ncbi:hypothetical protein [Polaribacter sp. Asnod6-C07]|uniref:hypothetical protein n=1 Tax=Polaribacter sp. Asnod6-C07 TaxID=3160582 RepID=UPI0038647C33